ncbi:hypothetical protein, partial [Algoriphagus sp.]|uniref:hypothetical protein n=1 Tax=Algoriphagus sp. TaxID=1872435 RepID=UPI00271719E7
KSLWSNPEAFLRLNPPCFEGKKQERNRNTSLTGFRSLASGQTHPSLVWSIMLWALGVQVAVDF